MDPLGIIFLAVFSAIVVYVIAGFWLFREPSGRRRDRRKPPVAPPVDAFPALAPELPVGPHGAAAGVMRRTLPELSCRVRGRRRGFLGHCPPGPVERSAQPRGPAGGFAVAVAGPAQILVALQALLVAHHTWTGQPQTGT